MPRVNIAGQRFGRLVAIKEAECRSKHWYWECRCDCGGVALIQAATLVHGKQRSCGCGRNILPSGQAARRNRYAQYRRHAQLAGLAFELTIDDFARLTQQPCHYCGQPPTRVHTSVDYNGGFTYNGLDRRDNAEGYALANVVPCCWDCNRAKRHLPYKGFVDWLDRVARWRNP